MAIPNSPASPINIRPATPQDVPLILQLIADLAEYEKAPEQAIATPEDIHRHLFGDSLAGAHVSGAPRRGPVAECVIGEVDARPQGFAVFFHNFSTWTGKPGLYLEDLFVRPQARGVGLGKALLLHLATIAHARGCGRFEWSVLDWNTPAIDFYTGLGAMPMTEWTIYRVTQPRLSMMTELTQT